MKEPSRMKATLSVVSRVRWETLLYLVKTLLYLVKGDSWGVAQGSRSWGLEEAQQVFARSFHHVWGDPSCHLERQMSGERRRAGEREQLSSAQPHRSLAPHFLQASLNKSLRRCWGSPGATCGDEKVLVSGWLPTASWVILIIPFLSLMVRNCTVLVWL